MKFKKGINRKQEFLFAKKPEDFLSENHLAKAIYEVVEHLNIKKIKAKYSELGQNAYDPKMMVRLIFNGYSIGIRSSRKISKACQERFDFVYLSDGQKPSHDRISDFRKDNLEEIKVIFKDIVVLGANLGLVKLNNVSTSIDGTKVRANASAKLSKDEEGLKKLLDKTKKDIDKYFEEAEKIDAEEDEKYGKENSGFGLPKHLQSKKSRKKAIEEAIAKLRKQKDFKKEIIRKEKKRDPTQTELKKIEETKINVTDHDAKYMKERSGVIKPNYNAQISVDEENQFILANDVTNECNDQHQLVPMLKQTKENISKSPDKAKADNGYYPQLEKARKLFPEIDLYVDDTKRREEDLDLKKIREEYTEIEYENLKKLLTEEGYKEYKKRMYTAEPPFGDMKFNLGFRYFLLRGLKKVKGEFNLMCIAHNLKKIFRFITRKGIGLALALKNIGNVIKLENINSKNVS
jgi:transposase